MRARRIWVGLALLAAAPIAPADELPTIDEVIARHVEARGGAERLAAVETVEMTGIYTAFSEPAPFRLVKSRPSSYRFDYQMMGQPATEAFDGASAWTIVGMTGDLSARPMTPPELAALTPQLGIDGTLVNAAEAGHTLTLVGREDYDGTDAWRIDVVRADGAETSWFLDADSYLTVGRIAPAVDFGQPHVQRMYYSEHREVDGVVFAHHVEAEYFIRHRVLDVEQVRVNPDDIDLAREFSLPAPAGMERLVGLEGEWDLKIEFRQRPNAPFQETNTRSAVESLFDGRLLVERFTSDVGGTETEVYRTVSFDAARERYVFTSYDSQTRYHNLMTGAEEEGVLTFSNVESETPWVAFGRVFHTRGRIVESGPESYVIEWDMSIDAGANWFVNSRETYTRSAE